MKIKSYKKLLVVKDVVYLLWLIGLVFSFGCNKKPAAPAGSDCLPLFSDPGNNQIKLSSLPVNIGLWPYFNPANNNEIVYVRRIDATGEKRLIITNLTLFDTTGLNYKYYGNVPKWGKTGWILVSDNNGRLLKIKSDGTQLTYITNYYCNDIPEWSPDGNKIAFFASQSNGPLGFCIVNEDGSNLRILDSSVDISGPAWSPDGSKIAYSGYEGNDNYICYIDTTTKIKTKIALASNNKAAGYFSWFPDSKTILYETSEGLYTVNIDTKKTVELKQSCRDKIYSDASVSQDGKTIIYNREKDTMGSKNNSIYYIIEPYQMNADGSNEKKLNLK